MPLNREFKNAQRSHPCSKSQIPIESVLNQKPEDVDRMKRRINNPTKKPNDPRKKSNFDSRLHCLFGFFLGCFVTVTGFFFLKSHECIAFLEIVDDAGLQSPAKVRNELQTLQSPAKVNKELQTKKSMHPIDCKFHHAENDPNEGMEDPFKLIDSLDPNFSISVHKQGFDDLRWYAIMERGIYYERDVTSVFEQILHSKPKGIVVDVGMNIGWYTLYSRAMGHDVVAFDPNPIMHSRFCNSLKLNNWWDGISGDSSGSSGVTTFTYGLGERVANLTLSLTENPGESTFKKIRKKVATGYMEVPVTTLDLVAAEMGWLQGNLQKKDDATIIYLLKVDCEGYERTIFRGASALLSSGLVQNIMFESTPEGKSDAVLEMFTFFHEAGYYLENVYSYGNKKKNTKEKIKLNQYLQNGDLKGSETHEFFSNRKLDLWWKRRSDP